MRTTILKLAAVAAPLALAAVPLTASPAAATPSSGPATVTPDTHLVNGEKVTVTASGWAPNTLVHATQCGLSAGAGNANACDQTPADLSGGETNSSGSVTLTFTVHTGKNFHHPSDDADAATDKCDPKHQCLIIVADGTSASTATHGAIGEISFGAKTKTSLKASKKSVKAHKSVSLTAKTTGEKDGNVITGKVKFKDNGKTFATKTLPASGKVTVKRKLSKVGKHKLTVTYLGDSNYVTSTHKVTVKVKK